jgi:hypothetical protein
MVDWTNRQVTSLFRFPIQLTESDDGPTAVSIINGQHRIQAMRDAGVRRALVAYLYTDPPPEATISQ